MESISKLLLFTHVAAGAISLVLFWIPVFTRKGGKSHRKIGKVYVQLMWVLVISAALLSIRNAIIGYIDPAIFLGFLSILTANPLWFGMSILKNKKSSSLRFRQVHVIMNVAILVFSLFMIVYAVLNLEREASVLMIIFGILGISSAPSFIKDYRAQLQGKSWFLEHFRGLMISGAAGYTAFFAFGGRQFFSNLLSGYWMILPWILPTIVVIFALRYLRLYYEKKGILKPSKIAATP